MRIYAGILVVIGCLQCWCRRQPAWGSDTSAKDAPRPQFPASLGLHPFPPTRLQAARHNDALRCPQRAGRHGGISGQALDSRYFHRSPGLNPSISADRASFAILRISSEPANHRRAGGTIFPPLLRGAWPPRRIRCPQNQWAKDHMIVMRRFERLQINGTYCRDTCL